MIKLVFFGSYINPEMSIIHEIEVWETNKIYYGRFVQFKQHNLLGDLRVSPRPNIGDKIEVGNFDGWFEVNLSRLCKSNLN